MFKHALWRKEYRQAQIFLWLMPIVCLLLTGVARGFLIWKRLLSEEMYGQGVSSEMFYFDIEGIHFLRNIMLAALMVLLAVSLIGTERRNLRNDFTFSLPYSRARIFMVKWGIGILFLAGSLVVNEAIEAAIIFFSPFAHLFDGFYHVKGCLFTFLIITGVYTFALFMGTITGSAASQTILTGIFSIFPVGFMGLFMFFIYVNFRWGMGDIFNSPLFKLMVDLSLFFHVAGSREIIRGEYLHLWGSQVYIRGGGLHLWGTLVYIAIFLPLGMYCYQHNRIEYNGRIILFPQLHAVFKTGVALCFALAIGMFATIISIPDVAKNTRALLLPYYIGFIGGGAAMLLLMRKLMKVRLKV